MSVSLDQQKKELRADAAKRRAAAFAELPAAGAGVAEAFLDAGLAEPGMVVSAYWPMRSELDTRPLLARLHEAGHRLCLPVVPGPERPLVFRAWAPGDELIVGGFKTEIPGEDKEVLEPDLLCVPMLAFDRSGYRLGYGGGFYDRTLEKLRTSKRVVAVGLAFSAQQVEAAPRGPHDQPLDAIVTEREVIRPGQAAA
jgi:5-formyltetrahydrofolate cyclo-ligase